MTRTVFVIGAGASKELNLPIGRELKYHLSSLLNIYFDLHQLQTGDSLIVEALRTHVSPERDINPYIHEAWHIRDNMPLASSIDSFIHINRENKKLELCAKLAIVRAILDAEKNSLLMRQNQNHPVIDFDSLGKTWYLPFFQLLTENCTAEDLEKRFGTITLIIFNYDRCIEHFFHHALQQFYKMGARDAASLVASMNIYHPYGNVGDLPSFGETVTVDFGGIPCPDILLQLAHKIKTFTEGTDPSSSSIQAIKNHMRDAERLVFLGFAFHKLNMELITIESAGGPNIRAPRCFATMLGISESDEVEIRRMIDNLYGTRVNVKRVNGECTKLFSEFWRSLAS